MRELFARRETAIMFKLACVLLLLLLGLPAACREAPPAARLEQVLTASWQSYVRHFISAVGQVMIPEEGGGTISEAQAYALLRAVWAGDEPTFGRVYGWTHRHLSRSGSHGDALLAWRWGRLPDGAWGVRDANSAADADLDYALALLLAHRRGWRAPAGLPDYLEESRRVQAAILAKEVVRLDNGALLLTPGNWHEPRPPYLVNPSYFAPAAYQLFAPPLSGPGPGAAPPPEGARADSMDGAAGRHHAWLRLRRDSYVLLEQLGRGLHPQTGLGLFPDWCRVDGMGVATPAPEKDTRFGWEAVRLPFRVALDGLWFRHPKAARLLGGRFLTFFKGQWATHGRLAAVYNYDGSPAVDYESPVLYAGVLAGALGAGDREFAGELAQKILGCYHEKGDGAYFEAPDHYYANNWAWLGLALYAGWIKSF